MFSTLRTRFGIPGVISVIALVFAMFGGAYAASNSGTGGKATASAKGKRGPKGPKGDTGPAGPAGARGATGAAGKDGAPGKDGAGVSSTEFSGAQGTCTEGGTKFEGSATTYACNGKKGKPGKEGSPWTAGGVLPSEATETGVWAANGAGVEGPENPAVLQTIPISFPIPLSVAPGAVFLGEGQTNAQCPGIVEGRPAAEPGFLCVYSDAFEGLEYKGLFRPAAGSECEAFGCFKEGASTAGALLTLKCSFSYCYGGGRWAVRAP